MKLYSRVRILSSELTPLLLFNLHLEGTRVQAIIGAFSRQEVLMPALFNDTALLDDHDLVRVLDCAQAMGDYNRGAIFHQAFERLLHQVFAFIVERTGRLVKDQQAWIAQQGPCNGNTLTLSTRKLHSALADQRVVPLRQVLDKFARIGCSRHCFDLSLGRRQSPVDNIFANSSTEEDRLLEHDADLVAPAFQLDMPDITSVNGDAPTLDVKKARNHVCDGSFPRAARSHERDDLAAFSLEADPMKHLRLAIVAEVNLLQAHIALNRWQGRHPWLITDGDGLVKQLEETLGGSQCDLKLGVEPCQGDKGLREYGKVDDGHRQGADAQGSIQDRCPAIPEKSTHAANPQQRGESPNGAIGPHPLSRDRELLPGERHVAFDLVALARKSLHDFCIAKRFF